MRMLVCKSTVLLIFILPYLLGACSATPSNGVTVAVLLTEADAANPLFKAGFTDMAAKAVVADRVTPGAQVVFEQAGGNAEKEAQLIASFIARNVQAIVIDPVSLERAAPVLEKARQAGIIIICIKNCQGADSLVTASVTVSEYDLGSLAGDAVLKHVLTRLNGEARVGVLACALPSCRNRRAGFQAHVKALPGIEIVDNEQPAGQKDSRTGSAMDFLKANPHVNLLWAGSSESTQDAIHAVRSMGLSGMVTVFGTGMNSEIAQELLGTDGILQGVADARPYQLGAIALQMALNDRDQKATTHVESLAPVYYGREDQPGVRNYLAREGKLVAEPSTAGMPKLDTTPTPYNPGPSCACNDSAHPVIPTPQ